MAQFTSEQMQMAFANVQSENWKDPIDKIIDDPGEDNVDCLIDAIVFFTGGGAWITRRPGNKLHVTASGYYCIGS